jgi:hypothetical protein
MQIFVRKGCRKNRFDVCSNWAFRTKNNGIMASSFLSF